jgi:hypothetical protein
MPITYTIDRARRRMPTPAGPGQGPTGVRFSARGYRATVVTFASAAQGASHGTSQGSHGQSHALAHGSGQAASAGAVVTVDDASALGAASNATVTASNESLLMIVLLGGRHANVLPSRVESFPHARPGRHRLGAAPRARKRVGESRSAIRARSEKQTEVEKPEGPVPRPDAAAG